MLLKPLVFAFVTSLLMLSTVHAEDKASSTAQDVTSSPMENRVRAYRERFEQRDLQRQQWQAELEQRREESRKRHEAMQKYYSEKMQARLTIIEQRQQQIAARHEAERNRAEDRYNYLSSNREALMKKALDAQLESAEQHEEMRKQAEERHRKIAAHRDAMMGMTLQERRAYVDEHASNMFGTPPAARPRPPSMMRAPYPPRVSIPRKPCRYQDKLRLEPSGG